jgi:hypothetical protein
MLSKHVAIQKHQVLAQARLPQVTQHIRVHGIPLLLLAKLLKALATGLNAWWVTNVNHHIVVRLIEVLQGYLYAEPLVIMVAILMMVPADTRTSSYSII